jgi:ribosomal subunit interface protein
LQWLSAKETEMPNRVQITFRNMTPSPAVAADVREHAASLDRYHTRISACRVVIEAPHRHQRKGMRFHIRIDVTVPGAELVASRESDDPAHEDVYVAIRDAFDALRRQLMDHAREIRHDVKHHEPSEARGRVVRLLSQGYGFISCDGRDVYFHENAVAAPGFVHLAVGDLVQFVETAGDKGPQASAVRSLTKHREAFPAAS